MYNKENKNAKLVNILLGVIAVFIIVFIVIWLVNRGSSSTSVNSNEQFETNINLMQETAKEFFASQLPDEIGENMQVTLQELYDIEAIDELKYGKETCNPTESYISVTKTAEKEYRVKSNLVCGDKRKDVTEKIKSSTVVEDKDGNTIINDDKDNVKLDVNKNDYSDLDITGDKLQTNDGKSNSTVNCTGPVCSFNLIPTNCTMQYEYEFVKRTVTCPAGYTIGGATCVNTSEETKSPTPSYTEGGTKIVDAKVNEGTEHRVYSDPIIKNEDGKYYCDDANAIVQGKYCVTYANKITKYNEGCPAGYNKVGNYCYKYANRTSPCPAGYSQSGNYCYKYANKITTPGSCPAGTTPTSDGRCLKTVTAVKSYTAWGNPVKTYQVSKAESTYSYELEKKVLLGSNKIGNTSVYTYAIYKRTTYYTCAQGTLTNGACYVYSNPTGSSTSCPSGYTDNGSNCYIRQAASTPCPSGYTDSGSTCYIKTNLVSSSYKECPSGYTELVSIPEATSNTCYKQTNAKYSGGKTYYSCKPGYTQTGTGANTQCYKLEKTNDEYYCEDANATRKGKLCYITIAPKFNGNTCESGFYLGADGLCHKTNTQTANPIWTDVDYLFSYSDYVPGYQKTGRGKFIQHCTPITPSK